MKKYGLEKSDYGHLAVAQRAWAAHNPYAVYRTPLTMEEYLAAPLVADPLARYDCVPVVAGAQAIVVAHPDRCPRGRAPVRVRGHRASFNYDNQEGDGLQTGISTFASELWQSAGVAPADIDVASIYDDYPTMVLAQLNDLGMIAGNDLARFARRDIGERRFPLNTWGGMLSAGQPGGPAGGLNGISEAVLQLQHRAGARQVKNARLAVATGYGMTMYRYGGTAAAAVLERME
jgi:acetyl-CoA acetyltransferase